MSFSLNEFAFALTAHFVDKNHIFVQGDRGRSDGGRARSRDPGSPGLPSALIGRRYLPQPSVEKTRLFPLRYICSTLESTVVPLTSNISWQ